MNPAARVRVTLTVANASVHYISAFCVENKTIRIDEYDICTEGADLAL